MPASGSEIQAIPHAASMTDEDWYASHATQCVEAWGRGKAGAFEHGFVSYENLRPYVTTQTVPAIPANDGLWLLQPSWDAVGKIVTVGALDNDAAAGGYRVESQPVESATAGCPAANSPAALQQRQQRRRLSGPLRAEFGAWPTGKTGFVLFGGVEIATPSPASGVDSLSSRTSASPVDDCSDVSPPADPGGVQYTCARQLGWGKCNAEFMPGYCCKSCFGCRVDCGKTATVALADTNHVWRWGAPL